MTIHPGRDSAAPWHVIQTVKEAGGDLDRTIMCHIDRTLFNLEAMLELAEKGRYLVFLLMIARMVRY